MVHKKLAISIVYKQNQISVAGGAVEKATNYKDDGDIDIYD